MPGIAAIPPFRKILIDVDTGQRPRAVIERAVQLGRQFDASVTLATVVPNVPGQSRLPGAANVAASLEAQAAAHLQTLAADLRKDGVDPECRVLWGDHAAEIIREAQRGAYDLVLRAHSAAGHYGLVDIKLLRKCPCTVWLVTDAPLPRRRLVAALELDADDPGMRALNAAILRVGTWLAAHDGGELHVLHIWSFFAEDLLRPQLKKDDFDRLLAESREAAHTQLLDTLTPFRSAVRDGQIHLEKGSPADVIPRFVEAHQVDLMIMGAQGHAGVSGLIMGNTAEVVLQRVTCSLLAVKSADAAA